MAQRTPLFDTHVASDARMVDFGGWDMPLHYGSQVDEHHAVRQKAGMFDVSHMTVVDVIGAGARNYLRNLLANDIAKLKKPGKALYSAMLNHDGGVIDDLITYYISDTEYRVVVNASTRVKDLLWMNEQSTGFDVTITERPELAMIAVQGPQAIELAGQVFSQAQREAVDGLGVFSSVEADGLFIARTGYTGEDGYEITLSGPAAVSLWDQLAEVGVQPCGLGARDTLRLEAGMNLYGNDMDESVSPLEANMAWTVALDDDGRNFNGRQALVEQQAAGVEHKLVGLVLIDKGVMRPGQTVLVDGESVGVTTSGSMSPTLKKSIAMARVTSSTGEQVEIEVRNKKLAARVVAPCFVRKGKALV